MSIEDPEFERMVTALRPWLTDLVVVGGWAHRMHYHHQLASRPAHAPITTRDADVAFATNARLKGNIKEALSSAGFREELRSDETPPIAEYHLGDDDQGFYVEFLAPLVGSGTKRDGSEDATVSRGGVSAQKLRHLEVLLVEPWTAEVGGSGRLPLPEAVAVRIANPVSFVVQKLLIHGVRRADKKAQDLLYVHDTLQIFGRELRSLNLLWRERVGPSLSSRQSRSVHEASERLFERVSDDIRAAVRIPADRSLRPEDFRAACVEGLAQLLANS